ncbi:cupin domain-containing protein [Pedobacter frigoris]|uniref:hypothetical protein n=1 Tax=Pedobacter frigoris TaxID=2571272 RepID=UPI00197D0407|nr:hypothetical protein [Pedobacter frigoris]
MHYDPERIQFGALRVHNDDWVNGGRGFGEPMAAAGVCYLQRSTRHLGNKKGGPLARLKAFI